MSTQQPKKQNQATYKNTFEVKTGGSSFIKNTVNEFKNTGTGIFDQLVGSYDQVEYGHEVNTSLSKPERKPAIKKEQGLFNYQEYHEKTIVRQQIKELTEQVKKEIDLLKKSDKSLLDSVRDIEKIGVESLPEKPGIYHIRFLEVILNILRLLRAKIGESRTWLQALISRKKKRGSLFATRAKQKGTQYSLSQELQVTRQTG